MRLWITRIPAREWCCIAISCFHDMCVCEFSNLRSIFNVNRMLAASDGVIFDKIKFGDAYIRLDSGNGRSPIPRQVISSDNVDLWSTGNFKNTSILESKYKINYQDNALECYLENAIHVVPTSCVNYWSIWGIANTLRAIYHYTTCLLVATRDDVIKWKH